MPRTVWKLKGFTHQIRLKWGATPKVYKARNIPFLVRNEVKKESETLLDLNIIEPVEASEWVSPLVVASVSLCGLEVVVW